MSKNYLITKSMVYESKLQFILMIFHRCSTLGLFMINVVLFVLLNISVAFAACSDTLTSEDPYSLAYGDGIDGPYIDNGNGTVTDKGNNLMWQKTDDGNLYNWQIACQYCEDLQLGGYSDWELPDIYQLSSINDINYLPTVNVNYFNNTKKAGYWTGSTNAQYVDSAWFVAFEDGYVNYSDKSIGYYVRCVRSGLSEPLTISITYSEANGKVPLTVFFQLE